MKGTIEHPATPGKKKVKILGGNDQGGMKNVVGVDILVPADHAIPPGWQPLQMTH